VIKLSKDNVKLTNKQHDRQKENVFMVYSSFIKVRKKRRNRKNDVIADRWREKIKMRYWIEVEK